MSKSLSNILTVFKIARILAKIVFILCIIGAAGCLLGALCLPLAGHFLSMEELAEQGLDLHSESLSCIIGVISCVGEAILAFWAEKYFKNVLAVGSPFTFESAKECFRIGVASLIISASISIASAIVVGIVVAMAQMNAHEPDFSTSISLSTGLFFMFISLLFKHGAELKASAEEVIRETFESQE